MTCKSTAGISYRGKKVQRWSTTLAMAVTLAASLGGSAAWATDGVWSTTAGGAWSDTSKWSGTNIANGVGASATFTGNISGNPTVTIDTTSRTLGILNLGGTDGVHTWTIAASGGGTLTFNTGSSTAAQINEASTAGNDTISAPVTLSSPLALSNLTTGKNFTISGNISGDSITNSTPISITASGTGAAIFTGNVSGVTTITNNSNQTLSLNGTSKTVTGLQNLNFGSVAGATATISDALSISSNLNINQNSPNAGVITLSGGVTNTSGNNAISFRGVASYYAVGAAQLNISGSTVTNVSGFNNLYGTMDGGTGSTPSAFFVSAPVSNSSAYSLELTNDADGILRMSGTLSLASGGLTINGPGNIGPMSPTMGIASVGQVIVSGSNNAITGATTVNAGYLYLDYSTNNNNKIDSASSLTLNSGYVALNGLTAGATQMVNGLVASGGANEVKLNSTATLNTRGSGGATAITRTGNATLDFANAAATTTIVQTANTNVNSILPVWMTVAGTDWATVSAGQIVAATYNTTLPTSGTVGTTDTVNYSSGASTTLAGALPINSLKITAAATLALGGNNLSLTSGGLLTNTNGAIIFNGTGALVAGSATTPTELVLQTANNTGLLQINTPVTASAITKSGAGEVLFTNPSLPTCQVTVNQGTLALGTSGANTASLSTLGNIALNSGGALGMTGTFNRSIGTGSTNVQFGAGGGGFAAVGGPLTVNIGGASTPTTLNASDVNGTLVLNNLAATHPITLANPLSINTAGLTISVGGSGSLSGQSNSTANQSNNGYAYAQVGAISGSGDLHVQGTGGASGPAGLLVPTGSLTYTGRTIITGAALYATPNAGSIPGNLALSTYGVLATSGTLTNSIGGGAGQITLGFTSGFAAVGGPLNVLLGNSTADPITNRSSENIMLGSPFAGNSVNYQNNISVGAPSGANFISVGPVMNQLSGVISGANSYQNGGSGQLLLSNVNTFTGSFSVGGGSYLKIAAGNTGTTTVNSSLGLAGAPLSTASSSGTSTAFLISTPGAGYTNGTYSMNLPMPNNSGGTQAVCSYTVTGGAVTAFTITTAGNGYYQAPTITIPGGTTAAVITPSSSVAWANSTTIAGSLDLNGTTTSEPYILSNSTYANLGQLVNSSTTAAVVNGDVIENSQTNLPFGGPGDIQVNGNVYGNEGNGSITAFKQGAGKLTLSGTNYQSGGTNQAFSLVGGTVVLDYTTNNTNKIGTTGTGQLILSTVALQVNGNAGAATNQGAPGGGTKLNQPGNVISVTANGTQNATLNLGTLTRANSSTVDFQLTNGSSGTAAITTTSTNINISGILTPTASGGAGYVNGSAVTISGNGGTGATGIAVASGGVLSGIIITNPGSGFTGAPTTFSFTVGSGATITGGWGSYGYLGGWATIGTGTSFAAVNGGNIGATTATYGTQVAPGMLLDVGKGNGTGGGVTFKDAANTNYAAAGITNAVVGAIRFNDGTGTAMAPDTLQIANAKTLYVGDSSNGNAAGGILVTPNSSACAIIGGTISSGVNAPLYVAQYSANPLRIDSLAAGASGGGIIKTGSGELQLTNANNTIAALSIYGGTVTANSPGAISGGITLANGATFKYSAISIAGVSTGGAAGNYSKAVSLVGPATFDNEGGTLSFTSASTNDFTTTSSIPWDLTITGTGDINLAGSISLGATYTGPAGQTLSTITPGFGQLIKNGTNNLTINATYGPSTISGGVIINNGTLTLGNATDTLPNNEPIAINANPAATPATSGTLALGANSDVVGPITLNGGSITGTTGTLQAMAYNFNAGSVTANLAGIVGIYKASDGSASNGTVTLSGLNTFTGATTITAGTLSINSIQNVNGAASALGNPTTAVAGTIAIGSGATPGTLAYTGSGNTTDRVISLVGTTGGATLDASGTGLLKFTSALSIPGSAGADNRKTLTLQGSGSGELAGAIGDSTLGTSGQTATSLVKAGNGTWVLSASNTYSGGTTISAGTLTAGSAAAFGTHPALLLAGGTADLAGFAITLNSLAGSSGTVTNSGAAATLTVGDNTSTSYSGTITQSLALTKTGSGTLTLTGANSYSGNTTINSGTLAVNADAALGAPASAVIVNAATLDFTTGFTTSRSITLATGSILKVESGTQTLSTALTATSLTKAGEGQLTIPTLPAALSVTAGKLQLAPAATNNTLATITSIAFTNDGTLDLTNNDLLIPAGLTNGLTISTYRNKITTQTLVTDSTAATTIALVSGKDYKAVTGTTTLGDNDLYGKFTYKGDANLDGKITADDYLALDVGYLFGLSGWTHGDFEQTGNAPTAQDYADIDASYQNQNGKTAAAGEIALHAQWFGPAYTNAFNALTLPVPEPTTLLLLTAGVTAIYPRKRRPPKMPSSSRH